MVRTGPDRIVFVAVIPDRSIVSETRSFYATTHN